MTMICYSISLYILSKCDGIDGDDIGFLAGGVLMALLVDIGLFIIITV